MMVNEKGKTTAQRIVNEANISIEGMSPQAFADLSKTIESALTTVRKEARTAAFKEVIGIAENEIVDADSSQNEEDFAYNRAIFDVVEAIQHAAANTEEGGGDG